MQNWDLYSVSVLQNLHVQWLPANQTWNCAIDSTHKTLWGLTHFSLPGLLEPPRVALCCRPLRGFIDRPAQPNASGLRQPRQRCGLHLGRTLELPGQTASATLVTAARHSFIMANTSFNSSEVWWIELEVIFMKTNKTVVQTKWQNQTVVWYYSKWQIFLPFFCNSGLSKRISHSLFNWMSLSLCWE